MKYIARQHDVMPKNDEDSLRADIAEYQVTDMRMKMAFVAYSMGGPFVNEEKRREAIPTELDQFEKFLGDR